MPTPNESTRPTTPRPYTLCPEIDTSLSPGTSINDIQHDSLQECANAEAFHDDDATPTKARMGKVHDEETAIESGTSRSTTADPESKPEDPYSYGVSSDLGFALTAETALTFSESARLSRRSSYLSSRFRPGSKFVGTQTDKQVYNVEVEIKQVDMQQSTVCGYLKIDGLTPNMPSMMTFFEGEIIGPRFSFITKHSDWGADPKTDLEHWERFPAFKPLAKLAKDPDFYLKNTAQRESVFMRWKERFLVPDHKIGEIRGASYAGFYYICFDQVSGTIAGIYFHEEHDRFQSLNLEHVHDFGSSPNLRWT